MNPWHPTGSQAKNLRLSEQRATAVAAALMEEGLDPGLFEVVAAGAATPARRGSTPEDHAYNRRINLKLVLEDRPSGQEQRADPAERDAAQPTGGSTP